MSIEIAHIKMLWPQEREQLTAAIVEQYPEDAPPRYEGVRIRCRSALYPAIILEANYVGSAGRRQWIARRWES